MSHLQVEQNSSDPHGLADLQAVGEQREAWWALVVGWQHLNVHGGDGAPDKKEHTFLLTAAASVTRLGAEKNVRISVSMEVSGRKEKAGEKKNSSGMVYHRAKVQLLPNWHIHGYRWKGLSRLQWEMSARGLESWSPWLLM